MVFYISNLRISIHKDRDWDRLPNYKIKFSMYYITEIPNILQSSAVITRCNISWYHIQQRNGNSRIWMRLCIHKRHPISHPYGRAMGCLLWGFWSEWVIKFNGLSRTVDSKVHIVHISRVIIAYTLESLSSLTQITHNLQATINFKKKESKRILEKIDLVITALRCNWNSISMCSWESYWW